jgi:hypothetical protein
MKVTILKALTLIIFFIHNLNGLQAQEAISKEHDEEPNTIIRLGLLAPGIHIEQKITPKSSVLLKFWAGLSFYYANVNGESTSDIKLYPTISIEPRYYTTLTKRRNEFKRTDYLSSGYVGFPMNIGLNGSGFSAGPVYGFQKTLGQKGYWSISIGVGYNSILENQKIGLIGDFSLGFILN